VWIRRGREPAFANEGGTRRPRSTCALNGPNRPCSYVRRATDKGEGRRIKGKGVNDVTLNNILV
jgi:hypothetical protein